MRRTPHTAMKAAEQIAAGVDWEKIEAEELSSLESMCRAEIQDRAYRNNEGRIEKYLHINQPRWTEEDALQEGTTETF